MKKISLFLAVMVVLGLPMIMAANDNNVTTGEVNDTLDVNSPPEVNTLIFQDTDADPAEIDPMPNENIMVWCNATVTDIDGDVDLDTAWADIWLQGNQGAGSDEYELSNTSCTIDAGAEDNDADVACGFTLPHYARPGDWTCSFSINDSENQVQTNQTVSPVSELLAFDVDNTEMDFGSLAWGRNSSTLINKVIGNQGNINISLDLEADNRTDAASNVAMSCDAGGYINSTHFKVGDSGADYDSLPQNFDNDGLVTLALNLAPGTQAGDSVTTQDIFFGIAVPDESIQQNEGSYPIKGTCTGKVTFNAIKA